MSGALRQSGATFRDEVASWVSLAAFLSMALATALLAGCTKQEKVVDVNTPAGHVEVYKEKPVTE
jgi:uncharacterized lipoprotein YajG